MTIWGLRLSKLNGENIHSSLRGQKLASQMLMPVCRRKRSVWLTMTINDVLARIRALVPETTDTEPVVLTVVVTAHAGIVVVQVAVVGVVAIVLGSRPKVSVEAEIVVATDVVACRNGSKARGVVG